MSNFWLAILMPTILLYILAIVNILDRKILNTHSVRKNVITFFNLRDVILITIVIDFIELFNSVSSEYQSGGDFIFSTSAIIAIILFFVHFTFYIIYTKNKMPSTEVYKYTEENSLDHSFKFRSMRLEILRLYFGAFVLFSNAFTIKQLLFQL